jgi:hypothetical protein
MLLNTHFTLDLSHKMNHHLSFSNCCILLLNVDMLKKIHQAMFKSHFYCKLFLTIDMKVRKARLKSETVKDIFDSTIKMICHKLRHLEQFW